jgi:hypothetical protein
MAQISTLSRRPTIGQKGVSWTVIVFFLRGPCGNRPDTVGQPPSAEIGVPPMPSLKAKKLEKLSSEKVLLEL